MVNSPCLLHVAILNAFALRTFHMQRAVVLVCVTKDTPKSVQIGNVAFAQSFFAQSQWATCCAWEASALRMRMRTA